ncbi:hypothetical protein [Catenuloplanes atrovinosus]|uniref:Uncharacterized protein n=1 Tax=Catenuloplanes atrovinosus TaxID=137266 RepID=A0AAE4CEJ5_9ACTN|nr:hypothetical protein [Catenuloplanes atrovinosus]MDR7278700.1 hypothetical protein [Catenuloplanes atrovinosus]
MIAVQINWRLRCQFHCSWEFRHDGLKGLGSWMRIVNLLPWAGIRIGPFKLSGPLRWLGANRPASCGTGVDALGVADRGADELLFGADKLK